MERGIYYKLWLLVDGLLAAIHSHLFAYNLVFGGRQTLSQ